MTMWRLRASAIELFYVSFTDPLAAKVSNSGKIEVRLPQQ
jgi:hypothetical protein